MLQDALLGLEHGDLGNIHRDAKRLHNTTSKLERSAD
jgi:hypothetical protein